MSDKKSKTEGWLKASGTSESGFSTTDVSAIRYLSDQGYAFEGVSSKEERLAFFLRTLEIIEGRSYPIEPFGGSGTAIALFIDDKNYFYNGESGKINIEKFDKELEKVKIFADFSLSTGSAEKKIVAHGEFAGIVESNKKVLDEEGAFIVK
ncbi:hypothetical protein [Pseudomonas atacamensis]|uniref:hypothetical protein n=1 Tax=Pseudomonas atacamensis TaxID=2565368 RepID=UPI00381DBFB3